MARRLSKLVLQPAATIPIRPENRIGSCWRRSAGGQNSRQRICCSRPTSRRCTQQVKSQQISMMPPEAHYNPDGSIATGRLSSAGRVAPLVQVGIMDDKGKLKPTGERGEIVIRGSSLAKNAGRGRIYRRFARTRVFLQPLTELPLARKSTRAALPGGGFFFFGFGSALPCSQEIKQRQSQKRI